MRAAHTDRPRRRLVLASLALTALVAAAGCSDDDATTTASTTASTDAPTDASTTTAPGAGGEFVAVTYNVAGLPEGISGSHPATNQPIISPMLNEFDLVLTQEDWMPPEDNPFGAAFTVYHDLLAKDADHEYQSEPLPVPVGKDPRRTTALASDGLNLFSRFPIGESDHQMWEGCFGDAKVGAADCLALKGFTMTELTLADGVVVHLYNLHGEAGSTPDDNKWSEQDYLQLAEYVNEHSAGAAILLGGDTNLHTDEENRAPYDDGTPGDTTKWERFLEATAIVDVCDEIACELDGADDSGNIDKWAFRSSDTITLEPLERTVPIEKFSDDAGEPLSDHDPVVVRWRWRAA